MTIKTNASATPYTLPRVKKGGPLGMIVTAFSIWRERKHLSQLDEAALRDIGKNREDAITEASRAVWDAPNRWFL